MTDPIEPLGRDEDQLRRIANRLGLHFHIDQFRRLTPHAGYKSETRDATEEELQMWDLLVPGAPIWYPGEGEPPDVPVWDVTEAELSDALFSGDYTLSRDDVSGMLHMAGFTPADRYVTAVFEEGLAGQWGEARVFVSKAIPNGYFYRGSLPAKLDDAARMTISVELRGFGV